MPSPRSTSSFLLGPGVLEDGLQSPDDLFGDDADYGDIDIDMAWNPVEKDAFGGPEDEPAPVADTSSELQFQPPDGLTDEDFAAFLFGGTAPSLIQEAAPAPTPAPALASPTGIHAEAYEYPPLPLLPTGVPADKFEFPPLLNHEVSIYDGNDDFYRAPTTELVAPSVSGPEVPVADPLPPTPRYALDSIYRILEAKMKAKKWKLISHKRGAADDPAQVYEPRKQPRSWGGKRGDLFRYTRYGELEPTILLSEKDVEYYIATRIERGAALAIWIQTPPAQYKKRYPNDGSSRCRYKNCPLKTKSILKGHWRVAFDEHPDQTGRAYDPFHNAFYMHLYCFETHCARLPDLVWNGQIKVQLDMRMFDYEDRNPMAADRDQRSHIPSAYHEWEARHEYRRERLSLVGDHGDPWTKEDFLWYHLTKAHIENETSSKDRMRGKRAAKALTVSLDKYLGDLALFTQMEEERKRVNRRARRQGTTGDEDDVDEDEMPDGHGYRIARARRPVTRKRARPHFASDDDDDDVIVLAAGQDHRAAAVATGRQNHGAKRLRVDAGTRADAAGGQQGYAARRPHVDASTQVSDPPGPCRRTPSIFGRPISGIRTMALQELARMELGSAQKRFCSM